MFLSLKNFRIKHRDFEVEIDSLTLDHGTKTAVVGANGSGKSTFLEGILGIHPDVSGEIIWGDGGSELNKRMSGVQLQSSGFPTQFLVSDIIFLHRELYKKQGTVIFDDFDIKSLVAKKYGSLSRGQKQLVDLFLAMAHDPLYLFLDEPSTGLDAAFSKNFMHHFQAFVGDEEKSAIFACHDPEELTLANNVLWFSGGKIKGAGEKKALVQSHLGSYKASFVTLDSETKQKLLHDAESKLGVSIFEKESNANSITLYGAREVKEWAESVIKQDNILAHAISVVTDKDFLDFLSRREK